MSWCYGFQMQCGDHARKSFCAMAVSRAYESLQLKYMEPVRVVLLGWVVFATVCVESAPDAFSLNDAYMLMGFKSQIWNDPYASMSNWKVIPAEGHACFWNGVKCADMNAYRVSSVQLTGMGLSGPIAPNLGSLSELVSLNLSYNGLSGPIPPALGSCTKLTALDLSHNSLSAAIPNQIASLTNLQKVYLGFNQFVGTLAFPSALTSLVELSVESNSFNGYPLDILANLNNLTYLNLGFNSFSGTIDSTDLTHFGGTLKQLLLGSNKFQGPVPSALSYLVNLEGVDFGGNNLTGEVPVELQYCPNLLYVNMSYNQLNGTIPTVLNKLLALNVLDLRGNQITGDINAGVLGCTNLTDLRLGENMLNGTIPAGIGNIVNLNYLDLSSNTLTGMVPAELTSLQWLKTLNLSSNQLTGSLFDLSPTMVALDLSENNFQGGIPVGYGNFQNLQTLSLGFNRLSGNIPSDLGKATKLKAVNLSQNFLTGPIPSALARANLSLFDVTNNSLSGEIPDTVVMRRFSPNAFLPGNPELCGAVILKGCPSEGLPPWAKGLMSALIPVAALAGAALLLSWMFQRGEYSARTIRKITDDFNNANLIGIGGLSTVYRGVLPNGDTVAVKRLRPEYYNNEKKNFEIERKMLLDVSHPNIVRVIGSCSSGNLKALVLEDMPNGNLDMHLHQEGGSNLPWSKRLDIAAGVAQGLAYLHGEWQGPHVMHSDLKGSSVLLDENFKARITDIRLANSNSPFISDGTSGSIFSGSIGYMPPEYALSPTATPAGDVYSFGTIMLELLTGTKPDSAAVWEGGIQGWVKQAFPDHLQSVIDPQLVQTVGCNEQIIMCTKIALQCTNDLPNERPSMQDVLNMFGQAFSIDPVFDEGGGLSTIHNPVPE